MKRITKKSPRAKPKPSGFEKTTQMLNQTKI
jgi:hypothetical protein